MPGKGEMFTENGILPVEDVPPEFNPETHYIVPKGFEVLKDKVVKKYVIHEIQEIGKSNLEKKVQELEEIINVLLGAG